ncbi:MAG: tetratricopeptide repeat protein, partial [Planctomycetes bacterium]|nr:tetratricopeptide repeat protein [Planctomycetota bacterium]
MEFLTSKIKHQISHILSVALLIATFASLAGAADRWIENELLNEAVGLQRDGRFDAALAAYHELLDQNQIGRAHAEALRRTAQLHRKLAQFPEASHLFQKFLAQYPDSVHAAEVMSAQAWIAVETGNLDEASTKFQVLHAKFPQSVQALEAVYWLATAAADKKEAARHVDWLLAELPRGNEGRTKTLWEKTLLLKCQLAASDHQWQEIKNLIVQEGGPFDEGPRKARAVFWLAEAEFRTGHPNRALALFDSLAEQTKNPEPTWAAMVPLRRAQLRARRQQWTEVLKILKKAEDPFPL